MLTEDGARYAYKMVEQATKVGECLNCHLTPSQVYPNVKWYGKAHRLVWEANKGPIPIGILVCHTCDNTRCINIEHLFLGTPQENMQDKVNKNRQTFGGPGRWLTPQQISDCVALYEAGWSFQEIGDKYNVNRRTVSRVVNHATVSVSTGN